MADSTPGAATTSNATLSCSYFLPTVSLFDWWLVKSPDNRLSISGISTPKGGAIRVFNSSPIVERFDVYSLKTADGIYILIRGIINEERTRDNGFSPEIFNCFYIGFPPNWETCWFLHFIGEQVEPANDSVNVATDTVSAICEDILSDDEEKPISVLSELPEEALENNQTPFPGDECQVSKVMSGVNVASGSGMIEIEAVRPKRKSPRLNEGSKQSIPLEAPSLKRSKSDEQKSISVLSKLPEEAPENNQTSFPGDECEVSKEMSGVNVARGSGVIRRSTRLHTINVCQQPKKKKKQKQTQQPTSRSPPKHPNEEPSSTSKAVENRDSDTGHLDSVSANLPEISSGVAVVENSFPTSSVTPKKATGHCNKSLLEGEEDMSIKTSEAKAVHGSGGIRRSSRLHNVKSFQKKQPATGGPATRLGKDQISASATKEKSDGRLENLSTPVQSQCGKVNTPSGKVTNKFSSKISKTSSAKTEVGHKKKRMTVETEAVNPKRKVMKPLSSVKSPQGRDASHLNKGSNQGLSINPKRKVMKPLSSVKSPQGRDASHLNKGSNQGLSIVSPESLSVKKSRSGRLLLPSLEFWRNEIPIYNADREIKEIQQDLTMTSPGR